MAISNKYRFFIKETSLGVLPVEVFPVMSNLTYSLNKNELLRGLQKDVSSDIVLQGNDYQLLYNLNQSGTCSMVELFIDTFCGGLWVRDYKGLIKLRKCVWETLNCTVKLGIETNDIAQCVLTNKDKKINLLDTSLNIPRITAKGLEGFIETITCFQVFYPSIPISYTNRPYNATCISVGQGWTMIDNKITAIGDGGGGNFTCEIITDYARQRVNGGAMPLGVGWISLGADWVRPVTTTPDVVNSFGDYGNPLAGDIRELNTIVGVSDNATVVKFDNGMLIGNVLDKLVNIGNCNFTIISDFFLINADNTFPNNAIYATAHLSYSRIGVWKTADIKRPNALNNSFILEINLTEFLGQLKAMFSVDAYIYEQGGVNYFRIEHESYFVSNVGLDASDRNNLTEGGTFEYKNDKLPRQEKFLFQQFTDGRGGTFDYYPIDYDVNCSDANSMPEIKADLTINNFGALYGSESYPDNGLTFAALIPTSGTDYIIGSDTVLNDLMGWSKLIPSFHFYGRPFASGRIDGVLHVFVQERVKQERVTIININNCTIHNLNTQNLIKSPLGWGKLESGEYDCGNCKLSVSLSH